MGENYTTNLGWLEDAPSFSEGRGDLTFVEQCVFWATINKIGLIPNTLLDLRGQRIQPVIRIAQHRGTRQESLQPHEEIVGKIGIRNRVVIRRVGEPN